ncbi:inorganic phosphate transporter [Neobacillus niacini]|uniref:inorganic phosphate transporter n=1 Tax=Neobacillus niacini TaxID=86668 RepID=UPI00203CDBD3|nr:inorganic phosphate transporter [Neobacillus niacini]MCM3691848.1 inorganic phosphate transporter [Neobacillus niacini]
MNLFATFEQSIDIEQALAEIESSLISRDQILVVYMDNEPSPEKLTGRTREIHSNAFEVGMACATGSAVIGACIGFVLVWGPIIWGLICVLIGFTIGYSVYYFLKKDSVHTRRLKKEPEVLVIIQCTEIHVHPIREILWKYRALTVGQTEDPSS